MIYGVPAPSYLVFLYFYNVFIPCSIARCSDAGQEPVSGVKITFFLTEEKFLAIYFAVSMFLCNFAAEFGALCVISSRTFYLLNSLSKLLHE